jgi:hypothetical protein
MPQKYRLTASTIASHFKHRCDRLFRWRIVESRHRGRAGIGWNVPREIRSHSRPGIAMLMEGGDVFEIEQVEALIADLGPDQVRYAGVGEVRGRQQVLALSLPDFLQMLPESPPPQYVAQVDIDPTTLPGLESRVLARFDLDPDLVYLGPAKPDLIALLPADDGRHRLRIWDFKASQAARHEHFIQIAYYSFLLEAVLEEANLLDAFTVDTEFAVVCSRQGQEEFELAPYRLAVNDFLTNRAPVLFAMPAADAHYHVQEKCALCEYMDTCQAEADAGADLSRVAYMSSESKRRLREAGIRSHRTLARLEPGNGQAALLEQLRAASHDLSINLPRYIATAQALEDGRERPLATSTMLMPRWENIRVVLAAEQDPVTNTCFALGLKTFEGWVEANNRPRGLEEVFILDDPAREEDLLLAFLRTLNALLVRVDSENCAIAERPIDDDGGVVNARRELAEAEAALSQFKGQYPRLYRTMSQYEQLMQQRQALQEAEKQAKKALKEAEKAAQWELYRQQSTLHFYVYDTLDLLNLKSLIERHLFTANAELLQEIRTLVRLFPPESILPDADTFRTIPGTIVIQLLRNMVALPAPHLYDLRTVSELYQARNAAGDDAGYLFRPRYGFGWRHSNQVAFERIHDVWNGKEFVPDARNPDRRLPPTDVRQTIDRTLRDKLRATDSIIRRTKQEVGDRLRLRKEPFRLFSDFDPLDFQMLEALRVFTILEASLAEMAVKHLHTLPEEDRAAKFECIHDLRYQPQLDPGDGSLWFTFDPACRDVKFDAGDFNLVLTPAARPEVLLGDVDGPLFDASRWRHGPYKVTLLEYDLTANPPLVRLQPNSLVKLQERVDLSQPCVLDRLYVDYNSPKVLEVLRQLQETPEQARHINDLVASGTVRGWRPFVTDIAAVQEDLVRQVARSGLDADTFLDPVQWRAYRGVFQEPLTLIWGPPGTGKTYTVAHILLGYALAAPRLQRPIRLLVTAFTHHAISNVLRKVSELAQRYGIDPDLIGIAKAQSSFGHPADDGLPPEVERIGDDEIANYLQRDKPCLVVGSTVWALYKSMKAAGAPIQPWFDVILIDEASQMKLPDALIAMSASRPAANIILAGDDQQLPPIIHGVYPEEHEHMLTSVFAFMRYRMEERQQADPDVVHRMLFQLEHNFRMNEPLTAYPQQVLYNGRFYSCQPHIRITTAAALPAESEDPIEFMLHPERPVILCWYTSPVSFTARNPLEAELVARLTHRLSEILIDERTGHVYTDERFAAEAMAVLSPHRAQNSTIRQMLAACGFDGRQRQLPLVDTVDKLQGQERDVVLVSYGVADEEYAEAEADFLLSSNRFNVATTRPRRKLIVFCSDAVLDVVPSDRRILLDSMMLKEFRSYCRDGLVQLPLPSPQYGAVTLNIQWRGFRQ